jgi:hypothetical protein
MPDILTHVLVGYLLGTLLAVRYEWLSTEYVTLVMLGALTPDLAKIGLVLPSEQVETLLGIPFDWFALHMLGGNLIVILLGTLIVASKYRTRVFLVLALGAVSHHMLDLLLINVSGFAYPVFWPLTQYHPPAGMVYLSTDRWPAAVASTLAVLAWFLRKYSTDWKTKSRFDGPGR